MHGGEYRPGKGHMYTHRVSTKIPWKLPHAPSRENLHHHIAAHIGRLIAQGTLAPGDVLPNEAMLGAELAVSRTALREAIKVLAAKGLVEVRRKTGTRVRPSPDWHMLDPEVLTWFFAESGGAPVALHDLLELRKAIEPAAAREAATRATAPELLEIQTAFACMEEAASHPTDSVEADLRLHLAILQASHNIFMRSFGGLVQTALRASFRLTGNSSNVYQRTLALHRAVVGAISSRCAEAAYLAMVAVLGQTADDLAPYLQDAAEGVPAPARKRKALLQGGPQ